MTPHVSAFALLPNLLSLARLLVSPYIFKLIVDREYAAVLIWFAFAGFSDFLDGWIARRFHASSPLGAILDPVADKVLQSGSFVALAVAGAIPWWLASIVLGRDLLILGFAAMELARGRKRDLSPSLWGKWSTVAQIVFVLVVVAGNAGLSALGWITPMQWITVGLTAWSGLDYSRRAFTQ